MGDVSKAANEQTRIGSGISHCDPVDAILRRDLLVALSGVFVIPDGDHGNSPQIKSDVDKSRRMRGWSRAPDAVNKQHRFRVTANADGLIRATVLHDRNDIVPVQNGATHLSKCGAC